MSAVAANPGGAPAAGRAPAAVGGRARRRGGRGPRHRHAWSSPTPTSRSTSPPRPRSGPAGATRSRAEAWPGGTASTRPAPPRRSPRADDARLLDTTGRASRTWSRRCSRGCDPTAGPTDGAPGTGAPTFAARPPPDRRLPGLPGPSSAALVGGCGSGPLVTGRRPTCPTEGPVILAPVHRSFADFGFAALSPGASSSSWPRTSLWKQPAAGPPAARPRGLPGPPRVGRPRGPAPRRGGAAAGARCWSCSPRAPARRAPRSTTLLEGAAFLAARTGAPDRARSGIGNSDRAMPKGSEDPQAPADHAWSSASRIAAARAQRAGPGLAQPRCTPPPRSCAQRIQAVYDLARPEPSAGPAPLSAPGARCAARPPA